MDLMTLAHKLDTIWLSATLQAHGWVWPALEIAHLFGLVLLFGSLIIVDLRVLGVASTLPLKDLEKLVPLALIGFGMNVVTGSMLVLGDPHHFLSNIAFQAKMVLLVLAGLNALYFSVQVRPVLSRSSGVTAGIAKISAGLSLALWAGVVTLARFIAYVDP